MITIAMITANAYKAYYIPDIILSVLCLSAHSWNSETDRLLLSHFILGQRHKI